MVPKEVNGTMNEKRTTQIAVRITPETKEILEKEAAKLKWSVAKLANEILTEWTKKEAKDGEGAINFIIHNNKNININGG